MAMEKREVGGMDERMDEKMKLEFIERVREKLECLIEEARELIERAEYVRSQQGEEHSIEDLINEICMYFEDCTNCPAAKICDIAINGCYVVADCAGCPRLRICVQKNSPGFLEYMRGD
jgi:hypothetical protein